MTVLPRLPIYSSHELSPYLGAIVDDTKAQRQGFSSGSNEELDGTCGKKFDHKDFKLSNLTS